ncbi:hypothetical protein B0H11DRAFT_1910029 [Mycena galericulata]|nr:hypothetical protein B0H11DRAFT_1910029 [Mycena galericulata]
MVFLPPTATAITIAPSPSDRPGTFYAYFDAEFSTAKLGRSDNPVRRKGEWERQCQGEIQVWLPICWEVPFAAKFERIIHEHYKRAGSWLRPIACPFCGVKHREKFAFDAMLIQVVEHYLAVLGWPIISFVLESVRQRSEPYNGLAAKSEKYVGTRSDPGRYAAQSKGVEALRVREAAVVEGGGSEREEKRAEALRVRAEGGEREKERAEALRVRAAGAGCGVWGVGCVDADAQDNADAPDRWFPVHVLLAVSVCGRVPRIPICIRIPHPKRRGWFFGPGKKVLIRTLYTTIDFS